MTIAELCAESYRTATEHGWTCRVTAEKPEIVGEKLMLVVTEIAEAMEEFRNGKLVTEMWLEQHGIADAPKPCGLPIELADAVIRIADFCFSNGIDLDYALQLKMQYNKTRPYRHGGKLA